MRLIDADKLRKDIQFVLDTLGEPTNCGLRQAMSIIDKTPSIEDTTNWLSEQLARPEVQESLGKIGVDTEPIIRCKDCKYWQEPIEQSGYKYPSQCTRDERAYMEECAILMDADDFCSRGEKR